MELYTKCFKYLQNPTESREHAACPQEMPQYQSRNLSLCNVGLKSLEDSGCESPSSCQSEFALSVDGFINFVTEEV